MLKQLGLNRNLGVLCGTIFVNVFFTFSWNPLLPLYLRDLGANEWEIGISFTAMGIARTLFAVVGGTLADRYGRKVMLVAPAFATVPLYVVAGLTDNWVVLVIALVVANALNALITAPFFALIAESTGEENAARSFSLSEFAVLTGLIGGPIAGAALLSVLDVRTLILVDAFAILATTSVRAWGLEEAVRSAVARARADVRAALNSNVRWFLVMGSLIAISFAIAFGPFFAILARDAWHNTEAEINLLFSAGSFAAILGLGLGRLSDRWGARRVLVLSALGYGVSMMAWGIAPSWEWGLLPILLAFALSEAMFIAQQSIQTEITTAQTRTSVFGVIGTVTGVIGGLGPTMGAWLVTLGGNPLPFIAAGVAGLLTIAALAPIKRKTDVAQPVMAAQAK